MHGHTPRRRFGQNFLADPHYVRRIVDAVNPRPGEALVEIGPGLGALTADLIARAGHLQAVEIDRDLAARLRERFSATQLTLFEDDALRFDFARLSAALSAPLRIVGNLPYNISSPLLFHLAADTASLRDLHVMLQKEVVARMTATPSTPDYGRLSVMLQVKFAIARLFVVPPGAFTPAPKVDSAVARLTPLGAHAPQLDDEPLFARLVSAAFAQRRKTLRNALAACCTPDDLRAAEIDPQARGENLAVADFVRLANQLSGCQGSEKPLSRGEKYA
ncbi:MAG: 16S rRNA (adenine(1518)-N(6)/adenine(1519)-N(6))-dimethyltransferase RsmA [Proteobacteria bacterium]|nr:16S rRNA (adenine(1518)-N(6)/adenine(1519)-N(6))-dimethyltransferase RsmA [Pseudomonadota bacterium]MCL2306638.1 16S rRNA (adenine(1518)-N(6)/adenine(1519)-N(6))-dimethyltransferase RsmA [Pseudomonadota bacterium]